MNQELGFLTSCFLILSRIPRGARNDKIIAAVAKLAHASRYLCPPGETGRRARFRCVCPQGHGGSNPLEGTCNGMRTFQVRVVARPCGFKSHPQHTREARGIRVGLEPREGSGGEQLGPSRGGEH